MYERSAKKFDGMTLSGELPVWLDDPAVRQFVAWAEPTISRQHFAALFLALQFWVDLSSHVRAGAAYFGHHGSRLDKVSDPMVAEARAERARMDRMRSAASKVESGLQELRGTVPHDTWSQAVWAVRGVLIDLHEEAVVEGYYEYHLTMPDADVLSLMVLAGMLHDGWSPPTELDGDYPSEVILDALAELVAGLPTATLQIGKDGSSIRKHFTRKSHLWPVAYALVSAPLGHRGAVQTLATWIECDEAGKPIPREHRVSVFLQKTARARTS